MRNGEGKIEIPLEDFWTWVMDNQLPATRDEVLMGVPKVNNTNNTIEINYAFDSEQHPSNWGTNSIAEQEWIQLEKEEKEKKFNL